MIDRLLKLGELILENLIRRLICQTTQLLLDCSEIGL